MIRKVKVTVTVTGADGAAAGSAAISGVYNGHVVGVHLDYVTQPATCDVTITCADPTQTILSVANNATDGWYYPAVPNNLASDGSALSNWISVPISGALAVSVAQGDAGSVTVTLLIEDD